MNERQILEVLLGEFSDKLDLLKEMIPRDIHFPEAPSKIKVAIGMRRAGKTYLIYQKILSMIQSGTPFSSILYVNFEDDRLLPLTQQRLAKIVDAFYSIYPENHERKCYLFFDEIQNVEEWPLVIRRLHDSKQVEIFLSGSSAKLLSKEIATSLRGRSLATEIWPYSFTEFCRALNTTINPILFSQKVKDNVTLLFHRYLSCGGFPEVITFSPDIRQKTLQEYVDIATYRDIIERHQIKNPWAVKYMLMSMLHNVGKSFSVNKIYNDMKSQGISIGKELLYEYVEHIEDAYLAFPVSLYDKSIRKIQSNPKKIYAIDPGIIRAVTMNYENDLGRLFENIIYIELRRLDCHVDYYLTHDRHEVDFLVSTAKGYRKLFQVAWDVENPKTLEREQRALQAAIQELNIDGELITLNSYLQYGIKL